MEIKHSYNTPNFNGLYFKNVSPKVQKALENSPTIQLLSENYDVFIRQYHNKTVHKYGTALNYGLVYRVKEIVPNLFNKTAQFNKKCHSSFALDPYSFPIKKEIKTTIENDLVKEAELIDINFFKYYLK